MVEQVVATLCRLGRGALLAKVDTDSADRLVPVHPNDRSTSTGHTVEERNIHGCGASGWAAFNLKDILQPSPRWFAMDSKAKRSRAS